MKNNKQVKNNEVKHDDVKLNAFTQTSSKIRYLSSCGYKTSEISKLLNIRYQWVRNVLTTPVTTPKNK